MKLGSLFSGVGGLDLAVEQFFGARTVWHSEIEPGPSKVLAARWPGIPNLGDITAVDWSHVEPVDIITGGSPCQDLSGAGRRSGMTEGTRSNLWVQMREAIAVLKPQIVVWENVRGAYSATADSGVEQCPGCVGGSGDGEPSLRALGRVLGDLADLGFDAEWVGLRASDVGAAHARFRVFVIANRSGVRYERAGVTRYGRTRLADRRHAPTDTVTMFPTPKASDGEWGTPRTSGRPIDKATHLGTITTLLPTITAQDANNTGGQSQLGRNTPPLNMVATLLPTPRATRGGSGTEMLYALGGYRDDDGDEQGNVTITPAFESNSVAEYEALWDVLDDQSPFWVTDKGVNYWPAISRWAGVMGRKSPSPTVPDGRDGRHRLNPAFAEWLMGLPAGWADGLTRNERLKAFGNGVVPQQAFAALSAAAGRF